MRGFAIALILFLPLESSAQTRLAGIQPFVAMDPIEDATIVESYGFDRWGDRLVVAKRGPVTLQEELLADGRALCRPDLGLVCPPAWRDAERTARLAGRGGWGERWPVEHIDAEVAISEYALVRGRILNAQSARRYVYLNFGRQWKRDFTVRVPKREAKAMAKTGLDLLALEGALVEVRGFVFEENGPMIELHRAEALEVVR